MIFRPGCRFVISINLLALTFGLSLTLSAAEKKEARVTQVIKDVQLVGTDAGARVATVNDNVSEGTKVRTGADSRVELTFSDKTIMRLGANTVFDFRDGTRNLNLEEGALLLQVRKNANGARISAGAIAATVTGTTVVLEYHGAYYKILILDGTARLYRPGHLGDSILVKAGQMVFGQPKAALSDPVDFDIGRFLKTSRFITDFSPLGSESLMASESQKQQREKIKKNLIDTNLVIFGGGTVVSLVDPAQVAAIDQEKAGPSATPGPIPPATAALNSDERAK
jgi:FecR protein